MNEGLKRKTIVATIEVTTGASNLDICSTVELILERSILGTSEFAGSITEVKVIKDIQATYGENNPTENRI